MPVSSFAKKITTGFFFTLFLLSTVTIVGLNVTRRSKEANYWVGHAYEVLQLTHKIAEQFQDAQTNHALYIINGNAKNWREFKEGLNRVRSQIATLKLMVRDNPAQVSRVLLLDGCLSERSSVLTRIGDIRSSQGFFAASRAINAKGLTSTFTCEDAVILQIIQAERSLLAQRKEISDAQASMAVFVIIGSFALAMIFLSAMYWFVNRTFKEKRRISKKLELSEIKFSSAFNDSAAGMALVSIKGKWMDVNNDLVDMLGYSKEELFSTNFQAITHPDDIERNLQLLKKAVNGELTKYRLEKRFIHKQGYPVWTLVNVSLVNNLEGIEPFFVSQIIDITASKKLIADIEMKNQMLTRTSDELQNKVDQLEDFNSIVAHNLRGPAGTIQYLLGIIREDGSAEEKESYMTMLAETSQALNETLRELMDILELKLSDQIRFDHCELDHIIEKLRVELGGEIIKAEATIRTNFEIDAISFPKVYLESIFYNMVSNSIKYRRPDLPLVINISSFLDEGKTILVFEDNGLGIDLERHGKDVFKLNKIFHAGHDSKGVGLFITKNQIVSHGGDIRVDSRPNEGARFTVSL